MDKEGKMTNQFQIEASDAILVIIDVQEKLSAAMPQDILEHMLQKVTTLLDAVHVLEIPVIVTEQYPKGLGDTLSAVGDKIQEYDIPKISKISFSCCGEPGFMEM
ncbi:MAG: isochorismatase family protein, partial [Anaerolineaceae bacterium]|nr:isochorismatase family protein [Anaerolineaceae bacterium]